MKNQTCGNCSKFKECNEEWGALAGKTSEACPDFDETMRMLAVRQHFANLILSGDKTIEVKPTDTPYRGPVAIYASAHVPTQSEHHNAVTTLQRLQESGTISANKYTQLLQLIGGGPYGRVIGTVEIVSTEKIPFTYEGLHHHDSQIEKHFAPSGQVFKKEGKPVYHWYGLKSLNAYFRRSNDGIRNNAPKTPNP